MNQYQARMAALKKNRESIMGLLTDAKINLANKPNTYGEFYDYVTDLREGTVVDPVMVDQVKAVVTAAPALSEKVEQSAAAVKAAKVTEEKVAKEALRVEQEEVKARVKEAGDFWESYSA